jgi:hypothetical protein
VRFKLIYLDEVLIIFRHSLDDHLRHFDIILSLLFPQDIRPRLPKCWFARIELVYLGHIIYRKSLRPSNSKTKALTYGKPSRSVVETQRF